MSYVRKLGGIESMDEFILAIAGGADINGTYRGVSILMHYCRATWGDMGEGEDGEKLRILLMAGASVASLFEYTDNNRQWRLSDPIGQAANMIEFLCAVMEHEPNKFHIRRCKEVWEKLRAFRREALALDKWITKADCEKMAETPLPAERQRKIVVKRKGRVRGNLPCIQKPCAAQAPETATEKATSLGGAKTLEAFLRAIEDGADIDGMYRGKNLLEYLGRYGCFIHGSHLDAQKLRELIKAGASICPMLNNSRDRVMLNLHTAVSITQILILIMENDKNRRLVYLHEHTWMRIKDLQTHTRKLGAIMSGE